MQLRQLEAFRATVISGTISAAAVSLRKSQPTVSRLLQQLEHELGIALFRREHGRVHLTHEGLRFYRRVDEVFAAFDELQTMASGLRNDAFSEVRIFSSLALSMTVVPEIVAKLSERYPRIKAKVITLDAYSYFGSHCETEHDVVLGPRIGFEAQVEQVPLAEVDSVCVLPKSHRLAKQSVVHVEDLAGESMISLLEDNNRLFIKHERVFRDAGVEVEQRLYCHASAAAYEMVRQGLGVALMEPFSAPFWEKRGIVVRPFKPSLRYEFIAGVKPGALQSASTRLILDLAREAFLRNEYASSC